MSPTPQPGDQPLDASAVEEVLGAAKPSGDETLDAALDALRGLGTQPAPEPTGELAALLGQPGPTTTSLASARARKARHVATGTTAVAGILLVTATAAAAIGTLRDDRPPARPTVPPAVVVHPGPQLPHPAGTGAGELPAVPAAATSGASSTPGARHRPHPVLATSPRRADDADEDSREEGTGDDGGQTPRARTSDAPDSDDAPEQDSSGSSTHDDGGDSSATGGGEHDDDSSWTSSSDGGGSDDGSDDGSEGGSDGGSDGGHSGDAVVR